MKDKKGIPSALTQAVHPGGFQAVCGLILSTWKPSAFAVFFSYHLFFHLLLALTMHVHMCVHTHPHAFTHNIPFFALNYTLIKSELPMNKFLLMIVHFFPPSNWENLTMYYRGIYSKYRYNILTFTL